jgi:heat-inducible transcriptional repressor
MLNIRHQGVLRAIVTDYIRTAEPVGSRTISRKYSFALSPASIRTIMADLEDSGYVTQTHTSSGRVPTDKGYRLYVDTLMDRGALTPAEVEKIEQHVGPAATELDDLLKEAGKLLSVLSPYVAVALAPGLSESHFQRVEFVSLAPTRILAILLTDAGLVHHRTVMIQEAMSQDDLDRIGRFLCDLLKGRTLREMRDVLVSQMAEEKAQYDRLLAQALQLGQRALEIDAEASVFVAGAAHIADQPEFADVQKMKALYQAFEDKSKLVWLLSECLRNDLCRIVIGREIPIQEIQDMSVVAAPYRRGEQILGVVGVLGPTRMDYGHTVALVETTATMLSRSLSEHAA